MTNQEELEKEIVEMQEVIDDKEASPEIRSNARSYIRGIKKAQDIISAGYVKKDSIELDEIESRKIIWDKLGETVDPENQVDLAHAIAKAGKEIVK